MSGGGDEVQNQVIVETPSDAAGDTGLQGILRLRDCFASRTSHSAQNDRTKNLKLIQSFPIARIGVSQFAAFALSGQADTPEFSGR